MGCGLSGMATTADLAQTRLVDAMCAMVLATKLLFVFLDPLAPCDYETHTSFWQVRNGGPVPQHSDVSVHAPLAETQGLQVPPPPMGWQVRVPQQSALKLQLPLDFTQHSPPVQPNAPQQSHSVLQISSSGLQVDTDLQLGFFFFFFFFFRLACRSWIVRAAKPPSATNAPRRDLVWTRDRAMASNCSLSIEKLHPVRLCSSTARSGSRAR